MLAKAEQAIYY